jgi:hypothetical protein
MLLRQKTKRRKHAPPAFDGLRVSLEFFYCPALATAVVMARGRLSSSVS